MEFVMRNLGKAAGRFLDRHCGEITLCFLLAALVGVFLTLTVPEASSALAVSAGDWGLSFDQAGQPPRGNISQEELKKYDAYFIDSSGEKTIFLTFDAGYENGYTPKILDVLAEEQVPAAFFLVGHYLKTNPDLVQRMADEGHIVANHTASHPDMGKISNLADFQAELETVEKLYTEITGQPMKKYYRPPQGKFSVSNLEQAKQLGYKTVFWSLAYADWDVNKQPSADYAVEKLSSRIHGGTVLLLHSTSKTNSEILQTVIRKWKAEGYTFRSLDELV